MRRWEEALARKLPPFIRRMIVAPCPCCGEPARWKLPRLRLGLLLGPLRFLKRAFDLTVLTLVAVFMVAQIVTYGSPHVAWDQACRHGKMYNPRCQSYAYCAYYGIHGRRVIFPEAGEHCSMIRLLPAPE